MNALMKIVGTVNNVEISIIENGEKLVPIKPICEALGVDFSSQFSKIENDEILRSTMVLSTTVAADGKKREMSCIPLMFVFGWLFTINPKNVKEEARENIIRYKLECYKILFMHFIQMEEFLTEKQKEMAIQLEEVERLTRDFTNAKTSLTDAKKKLRQISDYTFEEWKSNHNQMSIDF